MDNASQNLYACKHCDRKIKLDNVGNHNCFIGRSVYMNDNFELFHEDSDDKMTFVNEEQLPSEQDYAENTFEEAYEDNPEPVEEQFLDEEDENKMFEGVDNQKSETVWSRDTILALLNSYEAHYPKKVTHKNNQTQLWKTISDDLQSMGIKRTANQVRWKIYYLLNKYKLIKDHNDKSGRDFKTCGFYYEIDEILQKKKDCSSNYTVSSTPLDIKKKKTSATLPLKKDTRPIIKNKNSGEQVQKEISSTSQQPRASINNASASMSSNNISQRGSGSKNAKSKADLEKQWLKYFETTKDRSKATEERSERMIQIKSDANVFKKRYLNLRQEDIKEKQKIPEKKMKLKQERHYERLEMEKEKFQLLKKLARKVQLSDSNSE